MLNMCHMSGLIAAGLMQSPFDFFDIVNTSTHKTLRGPRSAMMFFRKSTKEIPDLKERVEKTIFPGVLGGPHNHSITATAACLLEADSKQFRDYQKHTLDNSRTLGRVLESQGFAQRTGGTDNHMNLVDVGSHGMFGDSMELFLESVGILVNKVGLRKSAESKRVEGIRLGSPAMTTRGCGQKDFEQIGRFVADALKLGKDYSLGSESYTDFKTRLREDYANDRLKELVALRKVIEKFSQQFEYDCDDEMI